MISYVQLVIYVIYIYTLINDMCVYEKYIKM